jgi:ADP-ribose pyrophosphatase YjhB (NUDIX family)
MTEPNWLVWAKNLQAIAQNGLAYADGNHFDIERYHQIREIATEMMALRGNIEKSVLLEIFKRENGYATPKVDVRGVVFRDGQILLVKEISDGKWTLPGGWADVNETPKEVVVREVKEESGYDVAPVKLLAVYDRSKHQNEPMFPFHVYKLFILCDLLGGNPAISNETSEVGFFDKNLLPELSVSRVTKNQIKRMFEHFRNSDLATDFD